MSGREVFRVQGPDGRGPWRPGLTGLWADPELWADFPPVQIAFGERIFDTIKLRIALLGGGAGCACASPEILCRWFSPTERLRLAKLKFRPVRLLVDRVLAESPDQLVFWRRKPLTEHDGAILWDALASKDAAE